jgi:hypothetical protein
MNKLVKCQGFVDMTNDIIIFWQHFNINILLQCHNDLSIVIMSEDNKGLLNLLWNRVQKKRKKSYVFV